MSLGWSAPQRHAWRAGILRDRDLLLGRGDAVASARNRGLTGEDAVEYRAHRFRSGGERNALIRTRISYCGDSKLTLQALRCADQRTDEDRPGIPRRNSPT